MSDIPSSGWCTDWSAYNTPRLWSMVAGEDNPEAWKQVIAWREVSDAVDSHLARLAQARETLEAAWPTSQSEASRAFVTRLNTLVARMEGAREEASSTSMALDNILQALRQAKQNIEPLWQQYRDKNEDVVPAWWDNAEEELDAQARAHMIAAEQVVEQYVPSIKVPDPYDLLLPDDGRVDDKEALPGPSGPSSGEASSQGGAATLPHDPPPTMPSRNTEANGSDETGLVRSQYVISPPSSISPAPGALQPSSEWEWPSARLPEGPNLSEALPTPVVPSPTPIPSPGGPPLGSGANPMPIAPAVQLNPVGNGMGAVVSRGAVPGVSRPFSGPSAGAMPSGAVIGGTPMGRQGLSPGASPGYRSIAKPSVPSWLSGSSGQSGTAGTGVPPVVGRGNAVEDSEDRRFDPDNPWSVAQGVDPVIEPTRISDVHDPGPGVIGQFW